jgi:hypothetical protein
LEKTSLQAYTDPAVEAMEKTLRSKGKAEKGYPWYLLYFEEKG